MIPATPFRNPMAQGGVKIWNSGPTNGSGCGSGSGVGVGLLAVG
jgi:hypothetical protein